MSEDQPYAPGEWETPWAEPFVASDPERAELAAAFAAAIRRTGSLMQLMSQAAADRIGINSTDLNCLNILSFRGQMTAGELAKTLPVSRTAVVQHLKRMEAARLVSTVPMGKRRLYRTRVEGLAPLAQWLERVHR